MWACTVTSGEGYAVSQTLRASGFPFLAVIVLKESRMTLVGRWVVFLMFRFKWLFNLFSKIKYIIKWQYIEPDVLQGFPHRPPKYEMLLMDHGNEYFHIKWVIRMKYYVT